MTIILIVQHTENDTSFNAWTINSPVRLHALKNKRLLVKATGIGSSKALVYKFGVFQTMNRATQKVFLKEKSARFNKKKNVAA